jgi:hypothetical protein
MSDRKANLPTRGAGGSVDKKRKTQPPSNRGFFIFMACCALGAVILIAMLVTGEIQGERVAPDIASKAKNVD